MTLEVFLIEASQGNVQLTLVLQRRHSPDAASCDVSSAAAAAAAALSLSLSSLLFLGVEPSRSFWPLVKVPHLQPGCWALGFAIFVSTNPDSSTSMPSRSKRLLGSKGVTSQGPGGSGSGFGNQAD